MNFAKRFLILRKEKKMTQLEISQIFNISESTPSKWETGVAQPDYDTLLKIAIYFNVSTDYLLGLSEIPGRPNLEAGKGPYAISLAGDIEKLTEEEKNIIKSIIDNFRSKNK
jgi:transcriptional regulator with XRE-family HTH domain